MSAHPIWHVSKTYGPAEGLSCCFRQWQAQDSHCRFLHGYALAFTFNFVCTTLDSRGWCLDFGGCKPIRAWLHEMFDHTMLVAADDPALATLQQLAGSELAQLRILPAVGCEAFAELAYKWAADFAARETDGRVHIHSVEVQEHAGNAAIFKESENVLF